MSGVKGGGAVKASLAVTPGGAWGTFGGAFARGSRLGEDGRTGGPTVLVRGPTRRSALNAVSSGAPSPPAAAVGSAGRLAASMSLAVEGSSRAGSGEAGTPAP
jgi:hypothetical protein